MTMVAALLAAVWFVPGAVRAQTQIPVPDVWGDQLLFFYDARPGRVSFLSISNPSSKAVTVEIAFYPLQLDRRLGQETRTLVGAANVVLDPATAAGGVGGGQAGLVVVTPIQTDDASPIVPPEPLAGAFTLANTTLGSAFGENAFGRLAVDGVGIRPRAGRVVDGSTIRFQRFAPSGLIVPVYFNPARLGRPEDDGNRLILVAFADRYAGRFDVVSARRSLTARFVDEKGVQRAFGTAIVDGVRLTNLQELSGGVVLNESGKVFLEQGTEDAGSLFGIFTQSLDTYASGQRLPST